jgi:hypothetical protein
VGLVGTLDLLPLTSAAGAPPRARSEL